MEPMQSMSESELEIMQIIWKQGGRILLSPLMEVLEQGGRSWKPNTVLTFLTRLVEKDMLRVEKQGRLNEYIALTSEDQYLEGLTRSFLGKVYGGDARGLVASLLKQDYLTSRDMEEIKAFWDKESEVE